MKKLFTLTAMFVMALTATAQVVDGRNFGIDGFAAYAGEKGTNHYLAGGTTGGAGGEVVKAETFTQLQAYLQSSKPYIVLVDKDISTGIPAYVDDLSTGKLCDDQSGKTGVKTTYGERITIAPNKTLIGIANERGEAPLFSRITFVMQCSSNVIIRNCRFTMNGVPILKSGENKIVAWRDGTQVEVGDPDCIGIQADKVSAKTDWGAHIWIDHCEFFNGNANNKDRYDGLVDCKNNVQWITISYNYFHDHDKACLFGKGDSDIYEGCRTISFHHNYLKNIEGSRLPLQRGGYLHYMNNYQYGCEDGWDVRTGATGYVDADYFENSKSPIRSDRGGGLNINTASGYDVVYKGCDNLMSGYTNIDGAKISKNLPITKSSWLPAQTVSSYMVNSHDKTADVPAICEKYSGAGKIVVWTSYAASIPDVDFTKLNEAIATQLTASCYDATGKKISGIYDGSEEYGTGDDTPDDDGGEITDPEPEPEEPTLLDNESICHFLDNKPSSNQVTVSGNYSDKKGTMTYAYTSYHVCLKIESSTYITITPANSGTVTLKFDTPNKSIKIDDTKFKTDENGQYSFQATAGKTYKVTKGDTMNLYLILLPGTTTGINTTNTTAATSAPVKKYVKDGRIIIEKDGKSYTTTGVQIR